MAGVAIGSLDLSRNTVRLLPNDISVVGQRGLNGRRAIDE